MEYKDGPNDVSSHNIFYDFYDSAYKDIQGWPGMGEIGLKRLKDWSGLKGECIVIIASQLKYRHWKLFYWFKNFSSF